MTDPNLNFRQTYTLHRIGGGGHVKTLARNVPVAPSNVGAASMPNYTALSNAAIRSFGEGRRTFAGQADDSFFLDLRVFDLLYGGDLSETGNDTLTGYNVNTIALQVPKRDLVRKRRPGHRRLEHHRAQECPGPGRRWAASPTRASTCRSLDSATRLSTRS